MVREQLFLENTISMPTAARLGARRRSAFESARPDRGQIFSFWIFSSTRALKQLQPDEAASSISEEDVRLLPADRFEALTALIESKAGANVILTPLAGDEGIDVIAVSKTEIRLLQCKHTLWDNSIDTDVSNELIAAFDGYRGRRLRSASSGRVIRAVLSTNGTITKQARRAADEAGVDLVAGGDIRRALDAVLSGRNRSDGTAPTRVDA
jgi:hypothetical protein